MLPHIQSALIFCVPESADAIQTKHGKCFAHVTWSGEVPTQKWMNFNTKVLSRFASGNGLKLKLSFEVRPEGGISKQKIEETKAALRELGMNDDVTPT